MRKIFNTGSIRIFISLCPLYPLFGDVSLLVNEAGDANIGMGGTFDAMTNSGDLRGVLNSINTSPLDTYNITFNLGGMNTINLGAMLPLINLVNTNTVNIDGANGGTPIVINGQSAWRGFFVRKGTASFENLVIQNVTSKGGTGGGGGMGAGAALFIDTGTVTLSNVSIDAATVIGGSGGAVTSAGGGGLGIGSTGSNAGTSLRGGAGGFGGNGGDFGSTGSGAGGGGINCGANHLGTGGTSNGAGLEGGGIGGGAGGDGFGGALGGINCGGGGAGGGVGQGGGGGGDGGVSATGGPGGAGGYGGGGGTGSSSGGGTGGPGNFGGGGGGGGSGGFSGGIGGFGGGGGSLGGVNANTGAIGGFGGGGGGGAAGGIGGGAGSTSNTALGGGGAGFGGAIFNRAGSLTINGSFSTGSNNSAAAGAAGGAGASVGWQAGNDCFFLTGTTITFDAQGSSITMSNSIGDDSPSSFVGAPAGVTQGAAAGASIVIGTSLGGTVTFGGVNTYGGGTTLNSGTLALSGSGSLPTAGTFTINNATIFDISQTTTGASLGAFSASAASSIHLGSKTLTLGSSSPISYAGSIQDGGIGGGTGGGLTKQNTGALSLSGTNTYTGSTTINAGALQILSAASLPSTSSVVNNGSLVFDFAGSGNYSGNITGSGSAAIQSGFVQLLGQNSYSGGTTVNAGTLQGNSSSLQGAIVNDASVVFDQTTDGVYAGNMSGAGGTLTKQNTGTLSLTGTNSFGGPTNITGGNLAVNGPLTTTLVTVSSSATLSGASTITGNVMNNGIVSPGNSIDTLTIDGNYTQASGSTLLIEITPTASDLLVVSGIATIEDNTTLLVQPEPGVYSPNQLFTILTASAINGKFTNFVNTVPTLPIYVRYEDNQITLITALALQNVAGGGNVGQIASYLDSLSVMPGTDLAYVLGILAFLPQPQLDEALAQLEPTPYKNFILAQQENVFSVSRSVTDHLNSLINTICRRDFDYTKKIDVWSTVFGDWARLNNHNSKFGPADTTLGYHARGGGALVGVDCALNNEYVVGVTGAYSYSNVHVNQARAKGHINSYYAVIYAMWHNNRAFIDAALIGGLDQFHASRHIQFGNTEIGLINRRARTNHYGWDMDGHIDGGVILDQWKVVEIRPFIAFDGLYIHENGFKEKGAESINLQVASSNNTLLRTEGGVNFSRCFCMDRKKQQKNDASNESVNKIVPQLRASVVYENFFANGKKYEANLVNQPGSFIVTNQEPNRVLFSPGVGVAGFFYCNKMSLLLDYNGEFGYGYRNQVAKIEFDWMF